MKRKSAYPFAFALLLLVFWIVISGTIHPQHLLAGVVAAFAVARFNGPMFDALSLGRHRFHFIHFSRLILKLLVYIVRANIEVARLVLSRDMPIEPQMIILGYDLELPINRALLANAITLTPGTLTVDIDEESFVVHCLTEDSARHLADWEIILLLGEVER